ncbi:cytochrome C oxidase subunit IV family protein [Bacteriovorax sp. DB6_IX]|uniref:cytochrome C oxidase subunit IV family protein n=1 Tax=Bacteriovorax sp. DB6_IX TaxID=1353530 RepID=UPI00038A3431|nr:cytochrome C oxidase subunit IV family protein [Bacteriovorax sp. DB6_IX]EQC49664.1 prokaryotic cytochrome C oxidase subunit IV [Bacteriovorax sp. DB6_IX]
MSDTAHHSHKKLYWGIFFALAVLTGLELLIPGLEGVSYAIKASSLIGLALGKAFLVAYFYMHLNEEKGWLKFIAAIPCSAGVYAAVVILESMFR